VIEIIFFKQQFEYLCSNASKAKQNKCSILLQTKTQNE